MRLSLLYELARHAPDGGSVVVSDGDVGFTNRDVHMQRFVGLFP